MTITKERTKCVIYSNDIWSNYKDMDELKASVAERDGSLREDITDEDAYSFAYLEIQLRWEDFMADVRHVDKKTNESWLVSYELGLWNRTEVGGQMFRDLESAIRSIVSSVDTFSIEEDNFGNVFMTGWHHDGINHFILRRLNEKGEYRYNCNGYSPRLLNSDLSRNGNLRKLLGWR